MINDNAKQMINDNTKQMINDNTKQMIKMDGAYDKNVGPGGGRKVKYKDILKPSVSHFICVLEELVEDQVI